MMLSPKLDNLGGPLTPKRLSIVTILAVMTSLMAMLVSGPAEASAYSLTGAGSTLVAPLEAFWAQNFEQRYGDKITYAAVGSGAGIAQITARTVDFGASDAPLTSAQAAACNSCVQIPWALSATGIAYNVPGLRRLRLTGPVLAAIYKGQITTWNAPQIAKLNKGETLPNLKITVVFRSDGSGDTYAFTDYLSRISPAWQQPGRYLDSGQLPDGSRRQGQRRRDRGRLLDQRRDRLHLGLVHHRAPAPGRCPAERRGQVRVPESGPDRGGGEGRQARSGEQRTTHRESAEERKTAYPLSTFTYAIIPRTATQKGALASWVYYAMTLGQSFGASLDFAPIPKVVLNAGIKSVKELQQK